MWMGITNYEYTLWQSWPWLAQKFPIEIPIDRWRVNFLTAIYFDDSRIFSHEKHLSFRDFPIFPMGFQWLSIKTARLFQYFLPISPGISWRSLEVFAENPLQPKGSFHSTLGPDGPGPPGPEWNDQRIYGICVSTGRNIEMQHLYICMNELCKYLRIPSKFKLDDSKICWIIKSSFRGGAKVAGFLCPAGAQRHHPCHRWIESPAHPPAISTDWLKGKGWEGFTRNNSGSSHGVLCIVPSSRSGKKMVYPWYTVSSSVYHFFP